MNSIPVHARNPGPMTGEGNWTFLIRGRVPTLIDAGTGIDGHLDDVERALDGVPLSQVLVTHAHGDHASGVSAIARRFPSARFRKMPWPGRDEKWPPPAGWDPLVAGERVSAGDGWLEVVHTPGHAPDHVCFWHQRSRVLFCGDLVQRGSTVWIPARLRGSLHDYLESLRRVRTLGADTFQPAHGAPIDEPEKVIDRYIQHRAHRERQVLDALARGVRAPAAIVADVYRGLADDLLPMALEGVVAHLEKLERDGRVRRDGEAWLIMDA